MIISLQNKNTNHLTLLGTDYGGWALDLSIINSQSVIYSFGVGTDISFDQQLIEKIDCTVHAFDPTPRSLKWISEQNLPNKFKFFDVGLSNFDGVSHFNEPPHKDWVSYSETNNITSSTVECKVEKLSTIMSRLGHTRLDVLKMDIEGSEFSVLHNMFEEKIFPTQILVEFHGHDQKRIKETLDLFENYDIFKRHDRPDYYLILK
jgi:FkbM family methyltransferase